MKILLEEHLRTISSPANIVINDRIKNSREICKKVGCDRPYHHFAFGQSPFPPPPTVVEALSRNASQHDYLPTAGILPLRELVAEFYQQKFKLHCSAKEIIISPGSKEMIAMIMAVIQGSVLIPIPSWVSYLPQAIIQRKEVVPFKTSSYNNYKLRPDLILNAIKRCSHPQRILIFNHPHNPTGAVYSRQELEDIAQVCRENDIVVIADEIYALTTFTIDNFVSMGTVYPEATIVTGGISKDRSAGGYRMGVGVFPAEQTNLKEDMLKVAGATYSCVAAPIQYAAKEAYSMNQEVEAHIKTCREVNAVVAKYIYSVASKIPGIKTKQPSGGFYLFLDFNELREQILALGFKTCVDLAEHILKIEHTALLPGEALLLNEDNFAFRCSYVDYDGEAAIKDWRENPPQNEAEENAFVKKHCKEIIKGFSYIARYVDQLRQGIYPKHH
ncbi:MAG: pyridoxal phosphate-dependent aminotransferase [Marinifilaceae bacterium]